MGNSHRRFELIDRTLNTFGERQDGQRVCAGACHSGGVNSTLSNNLGFGGYQSPEKILLTPYKAKHQLHHPTSEKLHFTVMLTESRLFNLNL
jgi:hypothetical protein